MFTGMTGILGVSDSCGQCGAGALVQSLKLPVWNVGNRGFETPTLAFKFQRNKTRNDSISW